MLRPLGAEQTTLTLDCLAEGFPERGRAFWDKGWARLLAWPGNRDADYPPGFFWMEKGEPAGIILTPASIRHSSGEPQIIVNVSSWYMRPAARWKAPLMLKALFRDDRVTFTDLTPTPDVQKMLPAFGFKAASDGIEWIATPLEATRRATGRVRPWRAGDVLAEGSPPDDLIRLHVEWGCLALVLEHDATPFLVVLKPMRVRGLPAARVLFAGSRQALNAALPALSRALLRHGHLFLRIDARPEGQRGMGFRPHGLWFARGEACEDRTDHFGSELALFDF